MIIEINITQYFITFCIWFFVIYSLSYAVAQIEYSTKSQKFTNAERSSSILFYIIWIGFWFMGVYGKTITATDIISLYYFITFLDIYYIIEIVLCLRHYKNDVRKYSMVEIYFNIISNIIIVYWSFSLWCLKI